ncbi:MAG TPA: DinB family protein [Bacteroidales bacterium]|nr:DinB family protein [Bacteroidales bacterium]
MTEFSSLTNEITSLTSTWEPKLASLPNEAISLRRNSQNRTIKQIVGHLIDSASNNTHRIVHLQYQSSPLTFPNYATLGNNDRWIAIQNYQDEDWTTLIQLWKYSMLHICHVINNVNLSKLENEWIAGPGEIVSLKSMIVDFPKHFKLHLSEIDDLINKNSSTK